MDLQNFVAQKTKINLAKFGVDILINPFSLADDAWLQHEFGVTRLQEIFEDLGNDKNVDDLMRIVYRLLDDDSKIFLADQIKPIEIDENGAKKELKLNGPQKLKYVICGASELMQVLMALAKAKGISEPMLEKMSAGEIKKPLQGKKKSTSLKS